MDIANTLKNFRTQRGLSQYKLAKISGVSQSVISSIESDSREPTIGVLYRLCESMDIRLSAFVAMAMGEPESDVYKNPIVSKLNQLDVSDRQLVEAMIDSLYSKSHKSSDLENNKRAQNTG